MRRVLATTLCVILRMNETIARHIAKRIEEEK